MNKNFDGIKEKIYDLEMEFEKIVMLAEIMKNFGDISEEVSGGAEKMQYLAEIQSEKCKEFRKMLGDYISEFQAEFNNNK